MRQQRLARSKTVGERGSSDFVEHAPARLHRETTRAPRDQARPLRGESVGAKLTRARTFNEEGGVKRPVLARSHSQTRPGYQDTDVSSHVQAYRERANFKPIIPEEMRTLHNAAIPH